MRSEADAAGFLRWHLPKRFGGKDGTNLGMAIVREHLARRGLRTSQRPTKREFDHRQLPNCSNDGKVRFRRAAAVLDTQDAWGGLHVSALA
ncbi:MAG: hypothetical protein Ct9H300mP26_5530 [Acidimicrobiales bacterium]|nr:MAG: hypothetical protein Ct9H300mP26_5530 [Acidimicrobiales bacterium]